MDYSEMVPTQDDFEFLHTVLTSQDIVGNLGQCEDYMDSDGFCKMCTALQKLQSLVLLMRDEDAWIGTK